MQAYDSITLAESDAGVVLWLPDGSSTEVPQYTIRRSAVLQEAIQASDTSDRVSITLPRGVLHDWLQCVDALKAAAATPGGGANLSRNPRLLHFLRVR